MLCRVCLLQTIAQIVLKRSSYISTRFGRHCKYIEKKIIVVSILTKIFVTLVYTICSKTLDNENYIYHNYLCTYMKCKSCESDELIKYGKAYKVGSEMQRYLCKKCRRLTYEYI